MKVEIDAHTAKQLLNILKNTPCDSKYEQNCTICELEDSLYHVLSQAPKPGTYRDLAGKTPAKIGDKVVLVVPPTSESAYHV